MPYYHGTVYRDNVYRRDSSREKGYCLFLLNKVNKLLSEEKKEV